MQTTYEGLGGVDERTKVELQELIEQYLHALGFSPHEAHVRFTVKTYHKHEKPHYLVKAELDVYGTHLCTAKAEAPDLTAATLHATDQLASHILSVLTRIHEGETA